MTSKTVSKSSAASSNWLQLQKSKQVPNSKAVPRKRQKSSNTLTSSTEASTSTTGQESSASVSRYNSNADGGDSLSALRKMIFGKSQYALEPDQPGKYLAIDCEMVGIGIDGLESSLARVSIVNYHGVVQLDEFVQQREKVVDYRTQYSGIRAHDLNKARPFEKVQKKVAELLKDKILIGHALHNDLKALLLSHPRSQLRDTQVLAGKFKVVRSRYIALRNLVKQELNVTIQSGEHSSVIDSRAAMAIYRLHRKEWEKGLLRLTPKIKEKEKKKTRQSDGGDKVAERREWWKEFA
ncbi:Ribonuclease H-like domain containing protein [Amanita muscaria]